MLHTGTLKAKLIKKTKTKKEKHYRQLCYKYKIDKGFQGNRDLWWKQLKNEVNDFGPQYTVAQENTQRWLYCCRAAVAAPERRMTDECAVPDKHQGSCNAGQLSGVLFNNLNRFCRIFFYLLRKQAF